MAPFDGISGTVSPWVFRPDYISLKYEHGSTKLAWYAAEAYQNGSVTRYKYDTNQQTHAESYTAIADIMFNAGWSKSLFVKERKAKRHTTAVTLYVAVGLWRHLRAHQQDQQQSGCEK